MMAAPTDTGARGSAVAFTPGDRAERRLKTRAARELEEIDAVFGALAHPVRRLVLLVLHFRGGSMPAGDIASRFSCSWPTVSRHLRLLAQSGLVEVAAQGRNRLYRVNYELLNGVAGGWLGWFHRD
jgi:DNA-binding transcriptional ArsR family regulator